MDWIQTVINVAAGLCLAVASAYTRKVQKDTDELQSQIDRHNEKLQDLRVELAKDYVTHADLVDIKNSLLRIETKLDGKQDK